MWVDGEIKGIHSAVANGLGDASVGPNLSGGVAGALLFLALFQKIDSRSEVRDAAWNAFSIFVDQLEHTPTVQGLWTGITGAAWVIDALDRSGFPEYKSAIDLLDQVDQALLGYLGAPPRDANFDLVFGVAGMGVYAAGRSDQVIGARIFEMVVNQLELSAQIVDGSMIWLNPAIEVSESFQELPAANRIDLGVAHGLFGVVGGLAMGINNGVANENARVLLSKALEGVLRYERNCDAKSAFGYVSGDSADSRIAWCYGDLGAAVALFRAGEALNDHALKEKAAGIALKRLDHKTLPNGSKDQGLCHGAMGNSLLARKFFERTGEKDFLVKANEWSDTAKRTRDFESAELGLFVHRSSGRQVSLGFLEGLSGIGLAAIHERHGLGTAWSEPLVFGM